MTEKDMYRVWAPEGKKWVDWVRPVSFVKMTTTEKEYHFSKEFFRLPEFNMTNYADAAIIVDRPGAESIMAGLYLAEKGYRPIPVFNGTIEQQGARATVDNQSVSVALRWGTSKLAGIQIEDEATPAFLVDSNRLQRFKMEISLFDNSWDVYSQDLPSAEYFLNNGITKVLVIGDTLAKDLRKILFRYQKKKMEILWTKGYEEPKKIILHKPIGKETD